MWIKGEEVMMDEGQGMFLETHTIQRHRQNVQKAHEDWSKLACLQMIEKYVSMCNYLDKLCFKYSLILH